MTEVTFVRYEFKTMDHITIIHTTISELEKDTLDAIINILPKIMMFNIGEEADFSSKKHPTKKIFLVNCVGMRRKMVTILSRFNRYSWIPHITAVNGTYLTGDLIERVLKIGTTTWDPQFKSDIIKNYIFGGFTDA